MQHLLSSFECIAPAVCLSTAVSEVGPQITANYIHVLMNECFPGRLLPLCVCFDSAEFTVNPASMEAAPPPRSSVHISSFLYLYI